MLDTGALAQYDESNIDTAAYGLHIGDITWQTITVKEFASPISVGFALDQSIICFGGGK